MMNKSILVIGYFGYLTNQLDGQTIRTRSIHDLLKLKSNRDVYIFDTQCFKKSKLNLFKLIFLIFKADIIFDIGAHGNLKYLFPVIFLLSCISRSQLNFVSVGGWLFDFLKNKPFHRFLLSKTQNIYVQTKNLCNSLRLYNFKNVHHLNNFRNIDFPELDSNFLNRKIKKLVFLARVHPLKGVNILFDLKVELERLGFNDIEIDIYGPIYDLYESDFRAKLNKSNINYLGTVQPDEVNQVLKNYDLMLFPTKYFTEGFPGSILDAYISGLPVIATNWLNANEFIEEGLTGYIVDFDDNDQFIRKVITIVQNQSVLRAIRENILVTRKKYSNDAAWDVFESTLKL